jgi:hypothetical protein
MIAKSKINSFLFLLLIVGSTFLLKSWEEYKGLELEEILSDSNENDIIQLHKYPPYICYSSRETENSILEFSSRYEDYYKSRKSIFGKLYNFIFYDKVKVNKRFYKSNFQLKNMFYAFRLLKEQQPSVANDKDDSKMALSRMDDENEESSSLILSLENSKIKEEVKDFRIPSEAFNYYSLGKFFANLLLKDKFVCYSVHDLSLLIFRIFNYKYLNIAYVYRFFNGFYDSLFEDVKDIQESKVRRVLMERFLTYNLQIILKIDEKMAQILVSMFDHKQSKEEINQMIFEFSSVYSFILKEVHYYRKTHNEDFKSYSTLFKKDPKLFVTNLLKTTSIFVSIFAFRLVKSLILSPIAPFGELVVEIAMTDASKQVEEKIREVMAPEHPEAFSQLESKLFKTSSEVTTNSLEEFIQFFEQTTDSAKRVEQLNIVDLTYLYESYAQTTI